MEAGLCRAAWAAEPAPSEVGSRQTPGSSLGAFVDFFSGRGAKPLSCELVSSGGMLRGWLFLSVFGKES